MESIAEQQHPVCLEDFEKIREGLDVTSLRDSHWLITGATGFIPAYLLRFLCWLNELDALGIHLEMWVRSLEKARRLFPWWQDRDAWMQLRAQDLESPEGWQIEDYDYVVHAASPATPAACEKDPAGIVTCNVSATHSLMEKLNPTALKGFLFLSSSEMYGDTGGEQHPDEAYSGRINSASPRALYPLAKKLGEAICQNAFRHLRMPIRIARIFHTYGPGMDLRSDGRVFADFVGNAVDGRDIVINSDGSARRAFCYIQDTVSALLHLLAKGDDGQSYNVGNPGGILSVSELADLILGLVPEKELRKVAQNVHAPQSTAECVFPNTALIESLGWSPCISPADGFKRTLDFYLK